MKLADYLYENSLTPSELRRILGVKCRSTIWRYVMNERVPQPSIMKQIENVTAGQVRHKDFLDPRPPRCARIVIDADGGRRMALPWSSAWKERFCQIQESDMTRLSPPVKRAMKVLGGRAWYTPRGTFLLDGRLSDLKRIMRAANGELKRRGEEPIPYPGVEPLDE